MAAAGLSFEPMPAVRPLVRSTLGTERASRQSAYEESQLSELAALMARIEALEQARSFTQAGEAGSRSGQSDGIAPIGRGTWGEFDLDEAETIDAFSRLGMDSFWGSTPYGMALGQIGDWLSPSPKTSPMPQARPAGLSGGVPDYSGFGGLADGFSTPVGNFGYSASDAMAAPAGGWGMQAGLGGGADRDGGGFGAPADAPGGGGAFGGGADIGSDTGGYGSDRGGLF